MDREQLIQNLAGFFEECKNRGYAIGGYCLSEAYPGIEDSSYVLEVKAPWVDKMDCSDALTILIDILFDTTTEDVRKFIFSIKVLDSKEHWHCTSQPFMFEARERQEPV